MHHGDNKRRRFMLRKYLGVFLVIVLVSLTFTAKPTAAQATAAPYIQINNGQTISITASEQPQISVQFGNRGQATLQGVFIRCTWDTFIRFTGQAQPGPFSGFQSVAGSPPFLFFPAATPTSTQLLNLPAGQNANVAFNIRLALPSPTTKGFAGTLQCVLLNSAAAVIASSQVVTVNVH
jgi:hypothetical protein